MRPRVFPAEDSRIDNRGANIGQASMRPRVFPAEDGISLWDSKRRLSGFNEAAGIPRGRRRGERRRRRRGRASMRPRVFPAEDGAEEPHTPRDAHASMRPRVFPAEDVGALDRRAQPEVASMRPRVFPAEDGPLATRCDPTMFATGSREVPNPSRTNDAHNSVADHWLHYNSSVFKDLPAFRALPGMPAAPERSPRRGGLRR